MIRRLLIPLLLLAASSARAGTNVYGYDAAGRLTNVSFGARSIAYVYDNGGNLLERRVTGGPVATADLGVRSAGLPYARELGQGNIVFRHDVTNAGPDAASNVRLSQTIPAGVLFAGASTGAVNGGVFEAPLGSMAAGAAGQVVVEVVPLGAGTVYTTLSVTNDTSDTNLLDNACVTTNPVAAAADTNANGLFDWWESGYLPNPAHRTVTNDPDGDGENNFDEQAGGTDPMASGSVLRVTSFFNAGTSLVVSFPAASGRVYRVETATNLPSGPWLNLATNLPGRGGTVACSVTSSVPFREYRASGGIPP